MTEPSHNFTFGSLTHIGRVRKRNEDYFGSSDTPNGFVSVVCDGMGGHVGGEKASHIAVESIISFLSLKPYTNYRLALSKAIIYANETILQFAKENLEFSGMGTTCVVILINNGEVFYAHVGDSRIYYYSDNQLRQITKDHSYVQLLIDIKKITEIEAQNHPLRHQISNALGSTQMKKPTICLHSLKPKSGDQIILCSDGLTNMVSERDIESVIKCDIDAQNKSAKLIEIANEAGGRDNITVQILDFK